MKKKFNKNKVLGGSSIKPPSTRKNLLKKREKNGLAQEKLAEKLGVSGRSVSKLENGIYMSDMSLYKDICNILDISLVEFISDETKVEKIQSSECDESINSIIETSTKNNNLFKNIELPLASETKHIAPG